jgi:outer membrane immunogenic protein
MLASASAPTAPLWRCPPRPRQKPSCSARKAAWVGLQAGYNWQSGNWVIGAETDIQWSGQRNGNTCINACIGGAFGVIDTALTWFGTTRARVGYANGSVLNYYTGGVAYGGVRTTITEAVGGPAGAITFSNSRTGWTLGSGVEASLGGNWTGKIEYLYVNLGKTSAAFTLSGNANTFSTEHRNHIFRAGLNYQFGKAGSMLAAAPASDWRGLYVGANVGSSLGFNDTRLTAVAASNERFPPQPARLFGRRAGRLQLAGGECGVRC